ncbi:MAG: dihydrofolate reductase [Prevotellaceae bacterium]|nr:dihydrofolate reductase [Prevotellaceae bacterium]
MLSIIAAIDENNAIGKNNRLMWHLPKDLQRFKSLTWGLPVIMGRKTFESIGFPLQGRTNIILTGNTAFSPSGCFTFDAFDKAVSFAAGISDSYFAIGGEAVYREAIACAEKIYLTIIHNRYKNADAFFPEIIENEWKEIEREDNITDDCFDFSFSFSVLQKIFSH